MRSVLIATFTACLGLGSMALAQVPSPNPTPGQPPTPGAATPGQPPMPGQRPSTGAQPHEQGEATTLAGCLTKAGSGQYSIMDEKTQKRVTFSAPDKIEPYLNQQVELTGETAGSSFVPQSVKRVATTCKAAPEK